MDINTLVSSWLDQDKNETTRKEILDLQKRGKEDELHARLDKRIGFGTAGLRAAMEAGFARMNDVTVLQASQGLCAYILQQDPEAANKGIVIGHDHRNNSERFAKLTAATFLRQNVRVYLLRGLVCTPMVPFTVGRVGAAAGIMITASHNPAKDNGYKVYWSNGVQIIPPHDSGIAASIDAHLDIPDESWDPDTIISSSDLCINQTETLKEAYIETLARHPIASTKKQSIEFVYTPMHGVGLPFVQSILSAFNFPSSSMHIVPQQAQPDPLFPTVKFPNPEEKGALDIAMQLADEKNVKIVFANDPDADRFSVAEKGENGWRQFTGDQIGIMLGTWIFRQYKASGKDVSKLAMLASTVSSKMLAIVAEKEGFQFRETLTGFKWLGNAAKDLEAEGFDAELCGYLTYRVLMLLLTGFELVSAYEEAIGYMVSKDIRDKDGVSALALFACLASDLLNQGEALHSYMASLYDTYGHFVNLNSYWICRDSYKMARLFNEVRKSGPGAAYPVQLGEWPIARLKDITEGYDSSQQDKKLRCLPVDKSGQMLSFELDVAQRSEKGLDGLRGTVRSSGTEPKCKYYLEGWGTDKVLVEKALQRLRDAIATEWLKVEQEGLESP